MVNIYKYTFYRIYTLNTKMDRLKKLGPDFPEGKALFFISVFAYINIFTIGVLLRKLGFISVDFQELPLLVHILFYVGLFIFFFF